MLKNLNITNFGRLKELVFDFGNGLYFLSGDNDLGKSFMLDSHKRWPDLNSNRGAKDHD